MAEFRYQAFISYGHADEAWARWLHQALETYRVPRHLVGRPGPAGIIPARLAPIFRDRDELSTSANLSATLAEALNQSAALVVVCSPAAAASRWVNEEIRRFHSLGRAERVFCVLVDGEAGRRENIPQALFDGVDDAEPLFADPREFADGKRLARQKLVAGLLGVPLDEIRRRDLQRRRRWLMTGVLGGAVALALAATALTSRLAEQREKERAEQLATFVVDLGERLQGDVDLETRGIIAEEAMRHLATLRPDQLAPETRVKVGLALRQVGLVNEGQAKSAAALDAYLRSREIFADLVHEFPEETEFLFELGQAEFYVFDYYRQRNDFNLAEPSVREYQRISQQLYAGDPSNRRWLLEVSYGASNLLAFHIDRGWPVDQAVLAQSEEAVSLAERSLKAWPGEPDVLAHYSTSLAWAADTQMKACRLHEAMHLREQTLEQALVAFRQAPSSRTYKLDLAGAHTGVAMVREDLGELKASERHRLESIRLFRELSTADASNVYHRADLAWRELLLARLLAETGREAEALRKMNELAAVLETTMEIEEGSASWRAEHIGFLLSWAELQQRSGLEDPARQNYARALDLLKDWQGATTAENWRRLAIQARYLVWAMEGQDPALAWPELASAEPKPVGDFRNCEEADMAARFATLRNDLPEARLQIRYLEERNYASPDFRRFCRANSLCSE